MPQWMRAATSLSHGKLPLPCKTTTWQRTRKKTVRPSNTPSQQLEARESLKPRCILSGLSGAKLKATVGTYCSSRFATPAPASENHLYHREISQIQSLVFCPAVKLKLTCLHLFSSHCRAVITETSEAIFAPRPHRFPPAAPYLCDG